MPIERQSPSAPPVAPTRRAASARPSTLVALALATLVVLSGLSAFAPAPADALSVSTLSASCSGVGLRTSPKVTSMLRRTLAFGARVTADVTVTGGAWRTRCAGVTRTGTSWWRITSIGGRSVKSLYGVTYLYAAKSLFKVVSTATTLYPRCTGATLRSAASSTAAIKARLPLGTVVISIGTVPGGSWTSSCGSASSGTRWYRITSIGGRSVSSLYGTSYVYAALGVLSPVRTAPVPAPTPAPTPTPAATPPATPAATLSATPSPTPAPTPTPTPIPIGTPIPAQANACFPPPAPTPTPVPTVTPTPVPTPTPDPAATPFPAPTATPVPTPAPTPTPAPWNCMQGIDVSNWQGTIDWAKVAKAGIKFAFLKASEGTNYVDPTYATNRPNAKANGVIAGAYSFGQPGTVAQAIAEADLFVKVASPASGDLLPVMDLEVTNGLGTADLTAWLKAWLGEVYARTGLHAAIYCSPAFWQKYLGDSAWFAQNGFPVLWIAHWTTATSPWVPGANWGGDGWTFWQYTSSGSVPGISGAVDMDRFHYAKLTSYLVP